MPGKRIEVTTDFIVIATEGQTIDGRAFKKEWFDKMAKNYDPEVYCAVINAEHFYGNYGTVKELRVGKNSAGKATLEAKLIPEAALLNQEGPFKRVFTSVEILEDFPAPGDQYLVGLAITNTPASTGTTQLCFKTMDNRKVERFPSEELLFKESSSDKDASLVLSIISAIKEFFTTSNKPKEEEDTMTDEQLKKITEPIATLQASVASLEAKFVEKFTPPKADPPPAAPATAATPAPASQPTDFSAIMKAVQDTGAAVAKLSEEFKNALKPQPGTPSGAGTGGTADQAFV